MEQAIFLKNNQAISVLNLYIREHQVKITKRGILESIYHSECTEDAYQAIRYNIKFVPFDEIINHYNDRFGHLI